MNFMIFTSLKILLFARSVCLFASRSRQDKDLAVKIKILSGGKVIKWLLKQYDFFIAILMADDTS